MIVNPYAPEPTPRNAWSLNASRPAIQIVVRLVSVPWDSSEPSPMIRCQSSSGTKYAPHATTPAHAISDPNLCHRGSRDIVSGSITRPTTAASSEPRDPVNRIAVKPATSCSQHSAFTNRPLGEANRYTSIGTLSAIINPRSLAL